MIKNVMSFYKGSLILDCLLTTLYVDLGVGGIFLQLFFWVLSFIDMFTSVKDTVFIPECLFDRQQESSKISTFPRQMGQETVSWI